MGNSIFSKEWFDKFIPLWDQVFTQYSGEINDVLEIGCYEGRATIYLCENFLNKGTNYTVVDTFEGSEKEEGMAKTMERLKVNKNIIRKYGAVSHECCKAMVQNLSKISKSKINVSITGIAGPGGGSKEKPVGLVYIGIKKGKTLLIKENKFKSKNRNSIQKSTVRTVINIISKII